MAQWRSLSASWIKILVNYLHGEVVLYGMISGTLCIIVIICFNTIDLLIMNELRC